MHGGYGFEFDGRPVSPEIYGGDYISELQRVLDAHVPGPRKRLLEWGSGITTQLFADRGSSTWQTEVFVTIDEYEPYQSAIFRGRRKPDFVKCVTLDLVGPKRSQADQELTYSTYPLLYGEKFDFIFIDGRRRMECAFMAALLSHPETVVILHDFRRARYQPILALFEIVEDGNQFRVLRPRKAVLDGIESGAQGTAAYMRSLAVDPPERIV